jgi:hypothetical protein
MLDNDRQELIATRLRERNALQPCPRCLADPLEIIGEIAIPWDVVDNNLARAPESLSSPLPLVLLACRNCGYVVQHISTLLGLPR